MIEEQTSYWITVLQIWVPLLLSVLLPFLQMPNRYIEKTNNRKQQTRLTLPDVISAKVSQILTYPERQIARIKSAKTSQYVSITIAALLFIYCIVLWVLLPGLSNKTTNITPFILVALLLTLVTISVIGITISRIIVLHRREYSITAKKVQFVVQEGFEQITARCVAATLNMGAHVTNIGGCPGEFLLYAELERGRLKIQVGKSSDVSMPCWIEVQSDSYLPTVVWDYGINANNLFTFINEYFKVQPQ